MSEPDHAVLDLAVPDLAVPQRLHVVGVGGPGMSAIAIVLAEMGHRVSGSDLRDRPVLERVRAAGVDVRVGHDRGVVEGCAAVTASTAVPQWNIELEAARRLGIPVMTRAAMLAAICSRARSIGVAGTHGKTSTTSMLMLIMAGAGLHPSFVVGGDVTDMGTGAQWTGGPWLVVEADESDGTHLALPLAGTILTNVEVDHLDFYGSEAAIVSGFDRYLAQIDGPKVLCADDPVCARLAAQHGAITYGTSESADYRATSIRAEHGTYTFDVTHDGEVVASVDLPLRGIHNVRNALGALTMAIAIGVDPDVGARALAKFGGVARRRDAGRRLRPPAHRDRSSARGGAQQWRWLEARRRRVPTEPLQSHVRAVARVPRCLRRRRPGGHHRHLSIGHDSDSRCHRQARGQRRPGRASVDADGVDPEANRPRGLRRQAAAPRRRVHLHGLR
jgi:UDP-N-acetylmuramate-alanine ligase